MKKKIFTLAIIAILGSLIAEEPDLLINPGFEESFSTYATGWTAATFNPSSEAALFYSTSGLKHSGARSFIIRNLKPNDSLLIQWVKVKPSSFYRLGAWVLTQGLEDKTAGASICVPGLRQEPSFVMGTSTEWRYIETYGKTGPDQTIMPVALRLGSYLKTVMGTAVFDDVSVTRVQSLPEGVVLYTFDAGGSLASVVPRTGLVPLSWIVPFLVIMGIALIALAGWVFRAQLLDLSIRIMEGGLALADRHLLLKGQREDRRISIRIPSDIPVFLQRSIQGGGDRIMEFNCSNLSREGFFVKADLLDDFKIGDSVNCLFKVADRRFDVGPALVMRKQLDLSPSGKPEDLGMGLRFSSKSNTDRARLTILLKALGKDSLNAFSPPRREAVAKAPLRARLADWFHKLFHEEELLVEDVPAQITAPLDSEPTVSAQTAPNLPAKASARSKAITGPKRSHHAQAPKRSHHAKAPENAAVPTPRKKATPAAKSPAKKPGAVKKSAPAAKPASPARKTTSPRKKT